MSVLWVGDLDLYMDETFLTRVFASLGENVVSVKSIRNKSTGGPAGYCFVDFGDAYTAERVLHKYNGTIVPGTNPVKKFKLNWAQYGKGDTYQGPEYSLFVGDLTPDVTDHMLQEFFQRRYSSCRAAKVVLDNSGSSRGYGFVRFSDEVEQRRSMVEMQGAVGCGGKPLRVSAATPKSRSQTAASNTSSATPISSTAAAAASPTSNANYYLQYQQYINAWQGYQQQQQQQYYQQYSQYTDPYLYQQQQQQQQAYEDTITAEHTVEDPNEPIDVAALNKELIETENDLYEELEQSRWQPIDSVTSPPKPVVA